MTKSSTISNCQRLDTKQKEAHLLTAPPTNLRTTLVPLRAHAKHLKKKSKKRWRLDDESWLTPTPSRCRALSCFSCREAWITSKKRYKSSAQAPKTTRKPLETTRKPPKTTRKPLETTSRRVYFFSSLSSWLFAALASRDVRRSPDV